jgi:hypothetical protein
MSRLQKVNFSVRGQANERCDGCNYLKSFLKQDDYLLLFRNRMANLGKLFPYIPKELNWMLLHFSCGTNVFYDTTDEFLKDLRACLQLIKKN